jgi:hypothetical protein
MLLKATLKGAKQLEKALKVEDKRQEKALQTAVKVEGFRLKNKLQSEIRSGAPGGEQFEPLSFIARRRGKGFRPNKPLQRLAVAVRYFVKSVKPFDFRIGWVGPKVSKSWKRIAKQQQEGFTRTPTDKQRRYFARKGGSLGKRSANRKYLFLRKSTTQLKTPDRPIIEPFWEAEQFAAWKNIRSNFKRKMRGEKI